MTPFLSAWMLFVAVLVGVVTRSAVNGLKFFVGYIVVCIIVVYVRTAARGLGKLSVRIRDDWRGP